MSKGKKKDEAMEMLNVMTHTDLEGKGALSFSAIFHSPAYKAFPLSMKALYVFLHAFECGTAIHIALWVNSDGVTSVNFFWWLACFALGVHVLWYVFSMCLEWYTLVKEHKAGTRSTLGRLRAEGGRGGLLTRYIGKLELKIVAEMRAP